MAAAPSLLPKKRGDGSLFRAHTLPLPRHRPPPAATVRPFTPDLPDPVQPLAPESIQATALHKPKTVATSSIISMYTLGPAQRKYQPGHGTLPRSKPRVHSNPVWSGPDADCGCPGKSEPVSMVTEQVLRRRPLSPTKLLPFLSGGPRSSLLHAPRPLKRRSSIAEPEGPAGPQMLRLLYQRATLAAMETGAMETVAMDLGGMETESSLQAHDLDSVREDFKTKIPEESLTPPPLLPRIPIIDSAHRHQQAPPPPIEEKNTLDPDLDPDQDLDAEDQFSEDVPLKNQDQTRLQPTLDSSTQGLKSILRKPGSNRGLAGLRVRFNPLSLLLDSALEGEYDLVQRVIYDVGDPSAANDEGITALHNAVCAGHMDIVRFLVQFGVNVNAADSDGWTPLHCAASCNNAQICKFLVESGAAVFASTLSDSRTAADKCEEQEDGYAQCSQFLYGVQEKMGVMNRAVVYALWDFEPENPDELRLSEGECLTVLKRDGQSEPQWWWVRRGDQDGYVPRNLLGLYPRIKPRQRSLA